MQKITKSYKTISIFIPEEDFNLVKQVNINAKKDPAIDKKEVKSKKNLVSLVTRMLWKNYNSGFEEDKEVKDETINLDSESEDKSSDEISDSESMEE